MASRQVRSGGEPSDGSGRVTADWFSKRSNRDTVAFCHGALIAGAWPTIIRMSPTSAAGNIALVTSPPRRPRLTLSQSFRVAWSGLREATVTQRNMRIHLLTGGAVVTTAAVLGIDLREWALLIFCIGAVIAVELINTAIESLVDLASPDEHDLARRAKDLAAAAVLVTSLMAVLIGTLILLPPLVRILLSTE